MVKAVEEYIISLLGVVDRPLPSVWHLQKEFFILTKINPKTQKLFNFAKHYEGAYSEILQESYIEPSHYDTAFSTNNKDEIILNKQGQNTFNKIKQEQSVKPGFSELLNSLKFIREIYDKLSRDELLFLMYVTYPEFIEYSNAYDKLVKNEQKRKNLCNSMLKKGIITLDRYGELLLVTH